MTPMKKTSPSGVATANAKAETSPSSMPPITNERPPVPQIIGEWRRVAAVPRLEQYDRPGIEAVDFTIYPAADGSWQLISCLRNTTFPGAGRLLYCWEAKKLSDNDWAPRGIFWTTNPQLQQTEGCLQAPHCVQDGGHYYLFHNSNGAFCLISEDGKNFRQHHTTAGQARFFDMGRDVMIFDNRPRDGLWYAFFTDVIAGQYPLRKGHTVSFRTARTLDGPWSADKTDVGVVSLDLPVAWNFIHAESPFVWYRNGWYYRLEQMNVLASRTPTDWNVPILTRLTPLDPSSFWGYWGYMAPELVVHEEHYYVAGYRYENDRRGIYLARLLWSDLVSKP